MVLRPSIVRRSIVTRLIQRHSINLHSINICLMTNARFGTIHSFSLVWVQMMQCTKHNKGMYSLKKKKKKKHLGPSFNSGCTFELCLALLLSILLVQVVPQEPADILWPFLNYLSLFRLEPGLFIKIKTFTSFVLLYVLYYVGDLKNKFYSIFHVKVFVWSMRGKTLNLNFVDVSLETN